jgi:sulfur carrier protein
MAKINGVEIDTDDAVLIDFLMAQEYSPTAIAVEINGEIVPKSQYATRSIAAHDVVEIVNFVGGG